MNANELRQLVITTLDDNKAQAITDLDVTSLTDVADYMVICSAISSRHTHALADKLVEAVKAQGVRPLGVEGLEENEWVLVDLHDVIVHIMLPETRDFYSLEKLWSMAETTRQANEG